MDAEISENEDATITEEELDKFSYEMERLTDKIGNLTIRFKSLIVEIDEKNNELQIIRNENEEINAGNRELSEDVEELKSTLDFLKERIKSLEEERNSLQEIEEKYLQEKEDYANLEKEINEIESRNLYYEEEIKQLELKYDEREAELNDKIVQMESLNVAIGSLMKENRKLREKSEDTHEIKNLQKEIENKGIEYKELEEGTNLLREENTALKETLDQYEEEKETYARLKTKIEEIKRRSGDYASLKKELGEKEQELNDKLAQMENLNTTIDSLMKENRKLRETHQKRTPEHKELQEVVKQIVPPIKKPLEMKSKLSTGFHKLDHMFGGGLKLGSLNLIIGSVSPARDRFLSELAINEMKRGYGVVYVTTDRPGKNIEKEIGTKIPKSTYRFLLNIVDTSSLELEKRFVPPVRYLMIPGDFSNLGGIIDESLSFLKERRVKHQILILDSLDGVLRSGSVDTRDIVVSIEEIINGYSAIGFFAVDPKMHQSPLIDPLMKLAASFISIDDSSNNITVEYDRKKITKKFLVNASAFIIQ